MNGCRREAGESAPSPSFADCGLGALLRHGPLSGSAVRAASRPAAGPTREPFQPAAKTDLRHALSMQNVLAIHEGRVRRLVDAILRYEPRILRGLTWRHFGYVALIVAVLSIRHATFDLYRGSFPSVNSLSFTWLNSTCGFFILLFAVVLPNLKRPHIPQPVALAIAVIAGCVLAALLNTWVWSQPTASQAARRPARMGTGCRRILVHGARSAARCGVARS